MGVGNGSLAESGIAISRDASAAVIRVAALLIVFDFLSSADLISLANGKVGGRLIWEIYTEGAGFSRENCVRTMYPARLYGGRRLVYNGV